VFIHLQEYILERKKPPPALSAILSAFRLVGGFLYN
jgi:hypothetical protein